MRISKQGPGEYYELVDETSGFPATPTVLVTDRHSPGDRQRPPYAVGWRFPILLGTVGCIIVLIANIALIIETSAAHSPNGGAKDNDGIAILYEGSCSQSGSYVIWTHVVINLASTILLAASNVFMQVLLSPTRGEINEAHARQEWLYIGLPGVRNLFFINRWRILLCALCMLSSIPLHLFYNAIISQSLKTNSILAALVTPDFVSGSSFNATGSWPELSFTGDHLGPGNLSYTAMGQIELLQKRAIAGNLTRLDPETCAQAYSGNLISSWLDVLVVSQASDNANGTNPLLNVFSDTTGGGHWVCMKPEFVNDIVCDTQRLLSSGPWSLPPGNMTSSDALNSPDWVTVDHCLARPVESTCTLLLNQPMLATVIFCNVVKLICFALGLFVVGRRFEPLATFGDAVASFCSNSDPFTADRGALSVDDVRSQRHGKHQTLGSAFGPGGHFHEAPAVPKAWQKRSIRSSHAVRRARWVVASLLGLALVLVPMSLMLRFVNDSNTIQASQFGQPNPSYLIAGTEMATGAGTNLVGAITQTALLANLPQLVLSLAYLSYNGITTSIIVTREQFNFSRTRQYLRVTNPTGMQRSTHYLSVPFKFAIPITATFAVLHWLTSQSIFPVVLARFDDISETGQGSISCGYSSVAIITATSLSFCMFVALVVFGLVKLKANMPMLSTCSAAISAACHGGHDEGHDAATMPLMYGVLKEPSPSGRRRVGFSAQDVTPLVDGETYQ